MTSSLLSDASAQLSELIAIRRAIHRMPELGFECGRTVETILSALEQLPLEIVWASGSDGAVAVLRGRAHDRGVLLRADMDALPIQEPPGLDFGSEIAGRMHACGHDLHTAILLGAARLLAARREDLAGDVVLMFQPAEELLGGSARMIERGVLDASGGEIVAAYALHVLPNGVPSGSFTSRAGTCMSGGATVRVTVQGRGTHASTPHLGSDPIAAACHLVVAYQTAVTRSFSLFDPALLTVGSMHAGTVANVIPETATLDLTVRAPSAEALARVRVLVDDVSRHVAAAMGVAVDIEVRSEICPLVNDADEIALVEQTVAELFDPSRFVPLQAPRLTSEDFALVLERVPGAFVFLGAHGGDGDHVTAPGNHSPNVRYDERVIAHGAAYLASLALRRLASSSR